MSAGIPPRHNCQHIFFFTPYLVPSQWDVRILVGRGPRCHDLRIVVSGAPPPVVPGAVDAQDHEDRNIVGNIFKYVLILKVAGYLAIWLPAPFFLVRSAAGWPAIASRDEGWTLKLCTPHHPTSGGRATARRPRSRGWTRAAPGLLPLKATPTPPLCGFGVG